MKRLDRYMLKEMAVPMFWATVVVTLLFQANFLIAEYRFLNVSQLHWAAKWQIILLHTPSFLQMALPVGVSMGGAMAMSRLARESELTALRAAGVPIMRVILPATVAGLVLGCFNFYAGNYLMPQAEVDAYNVENKMAGLAVIPEFASNQIFKLKQYTISIGQIRRVGNNQVDLDNVVLFEHPRADQTAITHAPHGVYDHGTWKFPNAYYFLVEGSHLTMAKAKQIIFNEKIVIDDFFANPANKVETQTLDALRQSIESFKKAGQKPNELETNYYFRFSVPAACLLFGLVSPVLAVRFAKGGVVAGVILSIFLVFLYYNLYMICKEVFGKQGWMPPMVAAWLPDVIFLVLGVWGVRRLE